MRNVFNGGTVYNAAKRTSENWLLEIIDGVYEKSFCNMMGTKV